MAASGSRFRFVLTLLAGLIWAVALGGISLVAMASTRSESNDDAFIVFVYVRHLLEHGSFYWNESQGAVDGFTSLLDLLVKTAAARALGGIVRGAFWTTASMQALVPICATALGWSQLSKSGESRTPLWIGGALLSGLVLASSIALGHASSFLLETPLYSFVAIVCTALAFAAEKSRRAALGLALASFLLLLTRPEGLLLGMVFVGYGALVSPERSNKMRWLPLAIFTLLTGSYFAWRIHSFGYWAPNTYYAKTSSRRWNEIVDGLRYVGAYPRTLAGFLFCAGLALGLALLFTQAWRLGYRKRAALLWTLVGVSIAAVIYGGGDSYAGARFLAAAMVLTILGLTVSVIGVEGRLRAAPICLFVVLIAVQLAGFRHLGPIFRQQWGTWPLEESAFRCESSFAKRLSANLPPDAAIAESDYQRFKYYLDARTIKDLNGLNDKEIAHQPRYDPIGFGKFSHEEGVKQDAAIWFWGWRILTKTPMSAYRLRDLIHDAQLRDKYVGYNIYEAPSEQAAEQMIARYRPASFSGCGGYLNFLVRDDIAQFLVDENISIGEP